MILGSAQLGSLNSQLGTVGLLFGSATPADADLAEFTDADTRVRFLTVQGRDRFFPVIPEDDPLKVA